MASDPTKYYDPNRKTKVPGFRRGFSVAEMNSLHHEIARRLVLGQKGAQIARDLNISSQTVSNVKNSPIGKEHMELLKGARDSRTVDIRQRIEDLAPKCVQIIEDQLDDPDMVSPELKSKNAFSLLSIVGYAPVRNVNVKAVQAILTGDDIERIKEKARVAGINSGVIDVN